MAITLAAASGRITATLVAAGNRMTATLAAVSGRMIPTIFRVAAAYRISKDSHFFALFKAFGVNLTGSAL